VGNALKSHMSASTFWTKPMGVEALVATSGRTAAI
jgi:hypothetical protein